MTRVDLGDGGPPVDIPDQWMPDWQPRVRAAVQRGKRHRDHLNRVGYARNSLRTSGSIATAVKRSGLPEQEVRSLAATLELTPPHADIAELRRKIIAYPVRDYDPPIDTLTDPEQWRTHRGRPRRIRIIHADPPTETIQLPEHHLTITITPIQQEPPRVGEAR